MKKLLTLFLLTAAPEVLAQSFAPFVTQKQLETKANIHLYVDPLGSDSKACLTTGVNACKTLDGAYARLPPIIAHDVLIDIAPGSYGAFRLSGKLIRYNGAIRIFGGLTNITPTTGSATGTATGGTAGSTATPLNGTLVMTGAGWTVNNFVGKKVNILSGTGSNTRRVIVSNTADTLTIDGTWTAPNGTSVFAIQDENVVFNTSTSIPNTPSGNGAFFAFTAVLDSNVIDAPDLLGQVMFQWVKFTPPSNATALMVGRGAKYWFRECSFIGTGSASSVAALASFSDLRISESYISLAASSTGFSMANGPFLGLVRTFINGGSVQVPANVSAQVGTTSVTATGFTTSAFRSVGGNTNIQLTGSLIDGSASGSTVCLDNSIDSFAYSSGIGGTGVSISNCGTALRVAGPGLAVLGGIWTGSGNTTAISLSDGGRVRITSSLTLTGTTEINIDGSTAVDITGLRALPGPPAKRLSNSTTFSSIWEL